MASFSASRSDSQGDVKPHRPWREIAKQASKEYDPSKALELAQELIHALDAESRTRMEHVAPQQKADGAAYYAAAVGLSLHDCLSSRT